MLEVLFSKVAFLEESKRAARLSWAPTWEATDVREKLVKKLGAARVGSGHDSYLKGIQAFLVIKAPLKWWNQWERYSFQDTITSTSAMHTINTTPLEDVLPEHLDTTYLMSLIEKYNETKDPELFQMMTDALPAGYLYTRAVSVNYLQLKTMYHQRKNHKLDDWKQFCKWLDNLPEFMELIGEKDGR